MGRTPAKIENGVRCCASANIDKCTGCQYAGLHVGIGCKTILFRDVQDYLKEIKISAARIEDMTKQLESAQPKWISVEERLPEDDLPENSDVKVIKVFVAIKGKNGTTVRTQNRHRRTRFDTRREPFFDWEWRYSSGKVTHWMPLPSTEGIE